MNIIYTTKAGPYFTPEISFKQQLKETGQENYIEVLMSARDSMTRADLDREVGWILTIEDVFNNVGIDRAHRSKIIYKIGEFLYEVECKLGGITAFGEMTLQELRVHIHWLEMVHYRTLTLAGFTAEITEKLIYYPQKKIADRMWKLRI
jgi:hypothetical protein